jgi:hypothetical protein
LVRRILGKPQEIQIHFQFKPSKEIEKFQNLNFQTPLP